MASAGRRAPIQAELPWRDAPARDGSEWRALGRSQSRSQTSSRMGSRTPLRAELPWRDSSKTPSPARSVAAVEDQALLHLRGRHIGGLPNADVESSFGRRPPHHHPSSSVRETDDNLIFRDEQLEVMRLGFGNRRGSSLAGSGSPLACFRGLDTVGEAAKPRAGTSPPVSGGGGVGHAPRQPPNTGTSASSGKPRWGGALAARSKSAAAVRPAFEGSARVAGTPRASSASGFRRSVEEGSAPLAVSATALAAVQGSWRFGSIAPRMDGGGCRAPRPSSCGSGGLAKAMSGRDVLQDIQAQWMMAISGGEVPSTRFGYVRRTTPEEINVYGRGLVALGKAEYHCVVSSIRFQFITAKAVMKSVPRLQRFHALRSLTFCQNDITSFAQLEELWQLPQIAHLTVMDNPLNETRRALRANALRILPGLCTFNGHEISNAERVLVRQILKPMDRLAPPPRSPSPKRQAERRRGPDLGSKQLQSLVDGLVARACAADSRVCSLHINWDDAMRGLIREVLRDTPVCSVRDRARRSSLSGRCAAPEATFGGPVGLARATHTNAKLRESEAPRQKQQKH
eukprot:NODE_4864_length_1837_cov_7.190643.p1 GENE.NODE_4864_length_1837_cov_7.190643~~NODE_4864_length_1837_cov_7.190643.p1  ORF type:complete len:609 (+),score=133.86 NODE_4864_length_1837_cov_7.190643:118-1827(+)